MAKNTGSGRARHGDDPFTGRVFDEDGNQIAGAPAPKAYREFMRKQRKRMAEIEGEDMPTVRIRYRESE